MNINSIESINEIFFNLYNSIFNEKSIKNKEYSLIKPIKTLIINNTDNELINTHFEESIYRNFINEHCKISADSHFRESGLDLINEFKNKCIEKTTILYNPEIYSKRTHYFLASFKKEFYENLSKILNTKPIDYMYYNNKLERLYCNGFNGIKIKNKPISKIFNDELYNEFFNNKLEKTNDKSDRIKTQELLKLFIEYIKFKNIIVEKQLIFGKDIKKCYGYNNHYKNEFLLLFIKWSKLDEKRISFKPNLEKKSYNRGFYYIKIQNN
jgi:hypothetical protein